MNHRDTEIEDGTGIAQEELMSNNKHTQDLERALEKAGTRYETDSDLIRRLYDALPVGSNNLEHVALWRETEARLSAAGLWKKSKPVTNDAGEGA